MNEKKKRFVYLILALTVLFYAIPKLPVHSTELSANVFATVWISFALIVIASQLYRLLGVDRDEEQAYQRLMRMKRWKMEQQVLRMSRRTTLNR